MIGRALAVELLSSVHQVWILTRDPSSAPAVHGAQMVRWDGKTTHGWLPLVDKMDAVINLAGAGIGDRRWSEARKRTILESRLNAGRAVTEAIQNAARKPHVLVQASAVGYYGVSGNQPLDEASPAGYDYLAKTAEAWEKSTLPVEACGVRRVILRTGLVLSPEGGVLVRLNLPFRWLVGGPLGSGKQWYSWIHLEDAVKAIRYLVKHDDLQGAFNLTAPNPVTMAEFGRTLGKVMRRPYWAPVPDLLLRAGLGEMSTLVLDGQRVLPKRLEEAGFWFQYPLLEEALEDLLSI